MNIVVFGAKGRVGSKVVEIAEKRGHTVFPLDICDSQSNPNDKLQDNIPQKSPPSCSKNTKTANLGCDFDNVDAVIDFSTAAATREVCEFCAKHRCALISGVTGRNDEQQTLIDNLAKHLPVVTKSNFSVGVNMLHRLCEIVAKALPDWDCEIVETHRRGKLDAPSGTAKSLATTIAKQKNFKRVTTHSLRLGSNFGRHEVTFATNGESLTLIHQAETVEIFALGAILEAEKIADKKSLL